MGGRKQKYTTEASKKDALAARNAQRYLDPDQHEKKKERDREYRRRKREQEKLQRHPDPLALLADVVTQETLLQEVDGHDIVQTSSGVMIEAECTEVYGHPEEDISIDWGDGVINGMDSNGMKNTLLFVSSN
jgi:hypothetical protein